ncbi:PRC-barrel domain-containing protein [Maricaulis maris]|uniref:PRC-barrel domain protein n=1 Tax=Maricaulis maris TaxID=74318 RepID=A0A495D1I4_9PROT|nr:PRC-barrel domain-containing protein [Maricaulis maris]RKQ95347.1 PRC-barrel domain protein [Maricaulis maris]
MTRLSILTRAFAVTTAAGGGLALIGAATMAQQDLSQSRSEDVIEVEGDANAPQRSSFIQDNDLFRAAAEAWDNSDLDRAPYTDDHHWVGLRVHTKDGGRLGEVERVRLTTEGEVEAIVVEAGGWLDIGGHEVQIDASQVSFSPEGRRPIAVIDYTRAEYEALPRFNEDAASEFPLSDTDYGDNENTEELDDGPSGSNR